MLLFCWPLMVSYHILSGIAFLIAFDGTYLLATVLVAPSHSAAIISHGGISTSLLDRWSQQHACMVWMECITSWLSQIVLHVLLQRHYLEFSFKMFTTVVINCKLWKSGIPL